MKWGWEGKMAVVVLVQTSKSHALPILKSHPYWSILQPQELPVAQVSPHWISPGKRGNRVTGQTGCPLLFQQPVPRSTVLHVPDCSARVREGDTPTLPVGSGGGSRQASSASLQAFHGSPPALGRAIGTKFQPCFSRAISEEFPELKLNLKPFQGGGVRSKPHHLKTCSDRGSAQHTKMNNK